MGHCCEHETIRDVFENIVHFPSQRMDTQQTKRMREHRQHCAGVSFVQAQTSSSRRALAPKGIFHHFQFSFQVRGRCVADQGNSEGGCSSLPLVSPPLCCVGVWGAEILFQQRAGTPACCYTPFSPFLFVRVSRMTPLVYSPHIVIYQGSL